ncbi:MAG: bifunctional [glutamate--ammonia ligase]-adenylyl-L-tyrosine phosphorylase/[glutamate--ammonia-ligase] adenylyltransferase [Sinobacteraceae bacterium]|nr:bifunctional [glutamate--ammonia ligase]-adenylyl-L-tyrosine phosphorylase/[glutamate--ammonia-ligase] adenylyltransferase [Nevskiaceae bacterium]
MQSVRQTLDAGPAAANLAAAPTAVQQSLGHVFAASDFVAQSCLRQPQMLAELLQSGELQRALSADDYLTRAANSDLQALSVDEYMAQLRAWRRRELVRIAWRDLAGWAELRETLADLSNFADAAINSTLQFAARSLQQRYGTPRCADGRAQQLMVLGMGKLGGGELNFSSDVDLLFLFPEHGETDGEHPISNEEYFTRLGQSLIRLLGSRTHDGFVLRVDMRLRPFGDSGPLVASFASFEDYLPRHGREWERYAYVKARAITEPQRFEELDAGAIRPFVYRRYLDFGVFESLRSMKALIAREVQRRELADDIKLGPGGIREIEFIVQAFQLIRGGRDRRLQTTSLLQALSVLGSARLLPEPAVRDLEGAYVFLRRLENRLQMLSDAQTHQLPQDTLSCERVALAMGVPDWPALLEALNRHRLQVSGHFRAVISGPDTERSAVTVDLGRFWDSAAETAFVTDSLSRAGFADAAEVTRLLLELRASSLVRKLDEPGRRRLQALLPLLLTDIGRSSSSSQLPVLRRVLQIVEAVGQRSTYFALLQESATARARLVDLAAQGDFLIQQIAAYPMLLDELLDARLLAEPPARPTLLHDLDLQLAQVAEDDPERQVEALRHFQRAAVFRVAVADLTGRLPLMRVSDRLTDIAELILERAMQIGWQQMVALYGEPGCEEHHVWRTVRLAAAGYGKLAGMELGYSSDLDLVFLHDSRGDRQETRGAKPIDNQVFFVRFAQRVVHLLTVHTAAGRLYEVDMRLRPSGKGGLLVTSIDAFAEYQRREAWTWEHQALLHARAVAGSAELRAEFERVRLDVLAHAVRRDTLREEVRRMRERMRRELSQARAGEFDIKQDAGGTADIEFLAQYWALRWAQQHPPVAMFADTIRQLESVASADLIPQQTVDTLIHAYCEYRARTHHLSLMGESPRVPAGEFAAARAAVTQIWDATLGGADAA